jgi:hypothetical protein
MGAMANLTVHNSPPKITLSPRQRLISPNNDGINDYVLFVPEVLKAISLKSWNVEIANGDGQIVRSEDGMGLLPEGFVWRGEDNQYKTVKDGTYFCRLVAEDEAGNTTSTAREKIVVDTTPPEVAIAVFQESEEGTTLAVKVDDESQIADWELIIYDRTGAEAGRFEGNGNIPETLTAAARNVEQGLKPEGEKAPTYSLEVKDAAGNRLRVERLPAKHSGPERIDSKQSDKKRKIWIEDF